MNSTKRMLSLCLAFAVSHTTMVVTAQNTKENVQELSKAAKKGMIVDANLTPENQLRLTYKMKVDKKSDEVAYEDYFFDDQLGFKQAQPTKLTKEVKPDTKVVSLAAFVGGSNSFNVLSMILNLQREEWERKWDYDRQQYKWGKRLSKESVKPRNSESKYKGFAEFANDDDGSQFIIASYDQKDDDDQFVALYITNDLNLKETKVPVNGKYSLVYCGALQSGNIFMILAPNKGMPDTKKYTYAEFTRKAELVTQSEFTAPMPNMVVMDYQEVNGALYFCAASVKDNDAFNQVFTSYAPISNPGYSTSANRQMDAYEKRVFVKKFDNIHLLKFEKGKLAFGSSTPVASFKSKLIVPPSQKKGDGYDGRKFQIQNLAVTPAGEYLVTGQFHDKKIVNQGNDIEYRYYDIVCMYFDASGNLKAQYAVDKVNDDRKSEVFQNMQNFFFSKDGKTAYWELLEVKGTKGYASFVDAYLGNTTFTAHYFPRIAKINLADGTISNFTELGNKGKFLVYRYNGLVLDKNKTTRYYVGHDEDYEKLWVGKYTFD